MVAKMAGKGSDKRDRVQTALRAALDLPGVRADEAIAAVRQQFPEVPRRTWELWRNGVLNRGADLQARVAQVVAAVDAVADPLDEQADAEPKRRRRGADDLSKPPALAGEVVEGGSTRRWVDQGEAAIAGPLELLKRLSELERDSKAMRECSIRLCPGGKHVITDPVSYGQAIAYSARLVESQSKLMGPMFSAQAVISLLKVIMAAADALMPDAAALEFYARLKLAMVPYRAWCSGPRDEAALLRLQDATAQLVDDWRPVESTSK